MKRTISIDMDDVLAKLVPSWIDTVNKYEGEDISHSDVVGWDIDSYFKCGEKVYEYLNYELFRNLPVMEDSVEVVKKLAEKYNVFIVTSVSKFPQSIPAKIEWLEEHFPFIERNHYVFCGSKEIIKADIMIDDGVHNLDTFNGICLLFDAPHNKRCKKYKRVFNWKQIETMLL